MQELGLLLVLVAVAILTYSSLVYFAEKEGMDDQVGRGSKEVEKVGRGQAGGERWKLEKGGRGRKMLRR